MKNPFRVRFPDRREGLFLGQQRLSARIGRLKTPSSDGCQFENRAALNFLLDGLRLKGPCQSLHHLQ
ncbi:MAG: hypothetical protein WB818_10090, partial [Desulfobacterales bacterium]